MAAARFLLLLTVLGSTGGAAAAMAPHDGPAHRIEVLTKKMRTGGRTAELLYQRAVCYIELRKGTRALADLEAAIALDAHHEPALVERVRVLAHLGRAAAARTAATQARDRVVSTALRAQLARLHSEVLAAQREFEAALGQVEIALEAAPDDAMILFRSVLRAQLGQDERRLAELDAVMRKFEAAVPSPVVEEEWVDALIATGDGRARAIVDTRLAESRFRSGWLIRRARLHRAAGDTDAADADLLAAMQELSRRIHPTRPDLLLVADRALALHLLGRTAAARSDLALLRTAHFAPLLLLRLEHQL